MGRRADLDDLAVVPPTSKAATTSLTYTAWKDKVDANDVKTATIDQSGKVTGQLTDNKHYESRIPTALNDNALAAELTGIT